MVYYNTAYLQCLQTAVSASDAEATAAASRRNQDAGSRLGMYSLMHDLCSWDKCSHLARWILNSLKHTQQLLIFRIFFYFWHWTFQ